MAAVLVRHSYGKSRIRLTKVTRLPDRHDVRELTIGIELEGDFGASYTRGDNTSIVATDTMKNVAYALAKEYLCESIEEYARVVAGHFVEHHAQVEVATVRVAEHLLARIAVGGREHPHAFCAGASELRTCSGRAARAGVEVVAGIEGLCLLKTADSAFAGFVRDRFTTLADSSDRLLATTVAAEWRYAGLAVEWNEAHAAIRRALVETFATHQSLSVQHTLQAMGASALEASPEIDSITLTLANKHRILADLKPFGLDNPNEVFVATDEPHGTISGTVTRS